MSGCVLHTDTESVMFLPIDASYSPSLSTTSHTHAVFRSAAAGAVCVNAFCCQREWQAEGAGGKPSAHAFKTQTECINKRPTDPPLAEASYHVYMSVCAVALGYRWILQLGHSISPVSVEERDCNVLGLHIVHSAVKLIVFSFTLGWLFLWCLQLLLQSISIFSISLLLFNHLI